MAKWRIEGQERKGSVYWSLRSGRGSERRALSLGCVSEEAARRAVDTISADEEAGRLEQVVEWHREDRDRAIRYLCGDPVAARLLAERPDFRRMPLRAYYDEVYAAWRAENATGGWRQEKGIWSRILEDLGDVRLEGIDAHRVADYLDALIVKAGPREGKPASGNAKRLHRAAIQALLKRAYRLRHIDTLPALAVFQLRGATTPITVKPTPLSLDEILALMEASEPQQRAMWAVGAGQGLRPSELVRMRWEDVDLERRLMTVRGSKTSLSTAVIPLTPLAHREIDRWWKTVGTPTEGLLFPSREGAYGPQGYTRTLKKAAAAAGISRRVYPYLLRDSFATLCWELEVPMDVARRILRHTDESMLQQVYCRPRPETLVERVAGFDFRNDAEDAP
ncbi:MAG: site-specific integrase [Myxococcota bacterium]